MRQNSDRRNGIDAFSSSAPGGTGSQAGRLQSFGRSAGGSTPPASQPKRTPSSKRSASSLASSLISSLSASSTAPDSTPAAATGAFSSADDGKASISTSTGGTTLPAITNRSASGAAITLRSPSGNLTALSQAAAAAATTSSSNSRPSSSTFWPSSRSSSPANTPGGPGVLGGLPRAGSGGVLSWAGPAAGLVREGSAGSSEGSGSSSPTPSARSFTEPGAGTSPLSQGSRGRASARQLPALGNFYSLEGGKTVLFKEASVKFLDPMGQQLGGEVGTSSTLMPTGQNISSKSGAGGGGSGSTTVSEAGTGDGAGTKLDPARRRSKVSFHPAAPMISFFETTANSADGSCNELGVSTDTGAPGSPSSSNIAFWSTEPACENGSPYPPSSALGVPAQHQEDSSQQSVTAKQPPPGTSTTGLESSSNGGSLLEGRKSGFAWFRKVALVLDSSSDAGSSNGDRSSAESDAGQSSSGVSINPVPVPKDGNSAARAVAYKQHHGYLPSPTTSSAGRLSRQWTIKSPGSTPLSRAASLKANDTASAAAVDIAEAAQAALAAGVGSRVVGQALVDNAAGAAAYELPEQATGGMQPLPPGAVPVFGPSASAASAVGEAGSSSRSICKQTLADQGSSSGRLGAFSAVDSSSSITNSSTGGSSKALKLGPASLPGPLFLAVSAHLPPAMQRDVWCLPDFVVLKKLYDGYASTICKARDRRSGTIVALKLYRMHKLNEISSHQVAREVRLHMGLQHENIVTLHAAWQEAGNVVLVQEFAGGGDLWSFIDANSGRLTERVTVSLVLQPFLRGLQYLHSVGIAHRDIKPENVLFSSDMVLKIADFGLSVNLREEPAVTRVGTLDYMAPEVLRCPLKRHVGDNKDRADLYYATAVDAWAVGVLAYELMMGRAPFSAAGASDISIQSAICTAAPAFPSRMSEPAKEFITAALSKVPTARPTVLHMLHHPWIRSFQRSCSTARAEPRTSQELGGKGRVLCTTSTHALLDASTCCTSQAGQPRQCAETEQATDQQQRPSPALQQDNMQHQTGGMLMPTAPLSSGGNAGGGNSNTTLAKAASLPKQASQRPLGAATSMTRAELNLVALPPSCSADSNAAAASVWNSDDNGLTGYASLAYASTSSCL